VPVAIPGTGYVVTAQLWVVSFVSSWEQPRVSVPAKWVCILFLALEWGLILSLRRQYLLISIIKSFSIRHWSKSVKESVQDVIFTEFNVPVYKS